METLKRKTIINDPVWGPIELHPLCVIIINTPYLQRLRYIKQMGGCCYVYPGAIHDRFQHSIGTSYLAGKLCRELQKKIDETIKWKKKINESKDIKDEIKEIDLMITEKEVLCVEIAGLCHDLGHGPFSHLFDFRFYREAREMNSDLVEWEHEDGSLSMLDKIFENITFKDFIDEDDIGFIKELIKKPSGGYTTKKRNKHFLFEIVANHLNKIDVDKWDYFSRDCHMLGLHHNFQCERTIKLAKVVEHNSGEWHISFPKAEWFNLFDMFYTRFTIHRRACQHRVVTAVEMMIKDALLKADKKLMFPPNADVEKQKCLSQSVQDMDAYLWVTDDVFHRIRTLPGNDSEVVEAKQILDRIDCRDFYKFIGEKKVTWSTPKKFENTIEKSKEKEEALTLLTNWIKDEQHGQLQENRFHLFETRILKFHYGNGDKNPLDTVKFYEKDQGVDFTQEECSNMFPSKFEQIYIQLFWKGTKLEEPDKRIIKSFEEMERHNCSGNMGSFELVTTRKRKKDA
ncbi:deoxynucleoside triphosphate triphosphohydrolase SAMHD1-like isoform X1 [Crassostrea virginica]